MQRPAPTSTPDIHAAVRAWEAGRFDEARGLCNTLLEAEPNHGDALHLLARIALRDENLAEAETHVLRAIAVREHPSFVETLAKVLRAAQRDAEAQTSLRRWIQLAPQDAQAHYALARLLADQRQDDEAARECRAALQLRPGSAVALNLLGNILRNQGRLPEAEQAYREALAAKPGHALAMGNLGVLLHQVGRLQEAEQFHRAALQAAPPTAAFLNNLAATLQDLGRTGDAEAAFRGAMQLDPKFIPAKSNLGMLLLAAGDFEQAWPLFEARTVAGSGSFPEPPPAPCRPWTGQSLVGKSIVIWPEQGHGDLIQFVRFAALLKKSRRAAHVVVACPEALAALLATAPGVDRVVTGPAALGDCDYWCYALGLPLQFRVTLDTLPRKLPYLRALDDRVAHWQPRLPTGPRVGLCWKGSARHGNDRHRSLPGVSALAPLWQVAGVNFISLQKGQGEKEAASPPKSQPLAALGAEFHDFADAAAVISQLDLVICVDTATAHLAGALGKPVWILLPAIGTDWRWMRDRTDSPWYPRVVRLFRQRAGSVWDDVVLEVASALQARMLLAHARHHRLQGDPRAAEKALRRAIELDAAPEAAHAQLTRLLLESRRWQEARPIVDRDIALHPRSADAQNRLSALAWLTGDMVLAESAARTALALDPHHAGAHTNLGAAQQSTQRTVEAEASYREAVRISDREAVALSNLASMVSERDKQEAEVLYRRAIDADPKLGSAYSNLALLLRGQGRRDEARPLLMRALELDPHNPDLLNNVGAELQSESHFDEALPLIERALELNPGLELARLNHGSLLLAQGEYAKGWASYEVRRSQRLKNNRQDIPTHLPFPEWQGEPLQGKSFLIWPEQGFGDEIQFVRYAQSLKAAGAREVVVRCKPALKHLLRNAAGVDRVITSRKTIPACDFWSMALTLPLRFGTTLDSIPAQIPYLGAPVGRVAKWRKRLPSGARAGIVWKGSRQHGNDAERSLASLAMLAPLWSVPGWNFVSLQKGQGEDEAAAPPAGQPLLALGAGMDDFADAAAIIAQLDLVICVDTAIAHLAGALGKPVWVLLPALSTDWRWLRGRDDSPWYPGVMRLFRQEPGSGWQPVIDQVAAALRDFKPAR